VADNAYGSVGVPRETKIGEYRVGLTPLVTAELAALGVDVRVEHQVNEFVDLEGAQQLAAQSQLLLDRWESLSAGERQLAHAAIRYFVIAENVEDDFDIGGLDDDKRIMTAVLEHLGLSEGTEIAAAS